jgi:hypothetical protein
MTDLRVEVGPCEVAASSFSGTVADLAGSVHAGQLSRLSVAELNELRHSVAAESRGSSPAGDHACARADKLIAAELFLRVYTQAAIDSKAAVIVDEERRLACERGER